MVIFPNRIDRRRYAVNTGAIAKRIGTFAVTPSVVATFGHNIHFLPQFLADITDPQVAGFVVKRDSLPGDVRNQLKSVLDEVTAARNAESTRVNEEAKQAIIDAGGKVRSLTDEQRQKWVETMKPVWAKFEKDIGADLIATAQGANATN